jgi:hypothetical protein
MSQTHVIELPEAVYNALMLTAQREGTTAAEVIAGYVARRPQAQAAVRPEPTQAEIDAANARLEQHIVSLGYATGTDNECIDANLARE